MLGLVAAGLLWRTVRYALGFPIWGDEAFVAVNFITRDYADLVRPLEYGQVVPLVFMWVELALSRLLGLSEWALRLLPFAAGVASLLLFWRFASAVLPRRPALLAVGFFAASYYAVRHATEAKPYSTDLLVSLGLTMLGWSVYQSPRSILRWLTLILLAGLGVWCSYPAVFVAGALGLLLTWCLVREQWRPWLILGWLPFGMVLVGSFLALYLYYAGPHAAYAARLTEIGMWRKAFPPLTEPLKLVAWLAAIHSGYMFAYPHGGPNGGSTATFLLFLVGAVQLWRSNRALLLLLLGPLPLTFIAAALEKYPYGGTVRTSLYLAPAICLLAGLGLFATLRRFLRGRPRRAGLQVAGLALAAFALGSTIADVWKPYSSRAVYNSHRAVRTIAAQTQPGDRWITFNAAQRVDYAPYLGDWRGVGGQFVFDALRFHPVPLDWAPQPESVQPDPPHRVWLLCYRGYKVAFPQGQFDAYLAPLTQRLGRPEHTRYVIKTRGVEVEALDVYLFLPSAP